LIKLAKYLKPFLGGLLLTFALLFGQAICDLNLPNYMSDIVNIGIQQNGIEHAAPDAISQDGMKLMLSFASDSEKELILKSYSLKDSFEKNSSGKSYDSIYPNTVDKKLFVKTADDSEMLDNAFGTATWTFIYAMQDIAKQSGQAPAAGSVDVKNVDFGKLYSMQGVFASLPKSILESAHQKAASLDSAMIKQSGAAIAKSFYKELGADISAMQTAYIVKVGLAMLLIALLGGAATVSVSYISSRIAAGVARDLRKDIFNKVSSFSGTEFDKYSTASLITRNTNDVTQIQMLLTMGIRMICYAPIMGIGGIIMAVQKSSSMAWIIAAACALLLGIIMVVFSAALPKFKLIQKLVDKLNLVARENLSGLMVIRSFGTREYEKERFDKANSELTNTQLFVNRIMVFMMPAMMLIMNSLSLVIVWTGSHYIADSAMQVGDMMAFMQYAMQVVMSFLMISMMFIFVPRAAVSADRIAEVLDTKPAIEDLKTPLGFESSKKGVVEFKNVSFRYYGAEEDALHDISFTAMPGQTTAFIGPTGSGKSTIANLILRFYDATSGEVLVDGANVKTVPQNDLRSKIGFVPQKGVLLSGTIASNLKYGKKDAADDELETAAEVAQAMEFINEKPERFNTQIAQGGSNVSGGQKQRLSIARALVKKPEIFIFDDSFSALDFKTDSALRKALKAHTGDSTVLLVAQRVSTIMSADQIIVLDQGRIVGRGTHKQLLQTCPQYYEIASSQLAKEEL